jgi:hypothetical protein
VLTLKLTHYPLPQTLVLSNHSWLLISRQRSVGYLVNVTDDPEQACFLRAYEPAA